ncbi:copper amine oxidase [Paenibacillus sp. CAA11]|uniref:stalk domain-containing protein n=1 Tax=Paenibacillus sp. CAA11 TaxID=1532905 RepID=UPI000D3895DE|nr:stalk domain-containing protein [Paenibacillus sp. CAA11]AWB43221.1 copper amine oxidase [Paenibacillus sp. CAA11]
MKKACISMILAFILVLTSSSAHAAGHQVKLDGVVLASAEVKNNRTLVPLRMVSESLGAKVDWSNRGVVLTKKDIKVTLKQNSSTAAVNGKKVQLDVKPYAKNNHVMVPLRFIAETFGCNVSYSGSTVTIKSAPLVIDQVKVKALQQEYHMTIGGVVQQISGNAYNEAIYNIIAQNKGSEVDEPASYSWMVNTDVPGSYYKNNQFDFLDEKGNSIKRYDIYTLIRSLPAELLVGYPDVLIYDASEGKWYLFNSAARGSIDQLIDKAAQNGYLKVISDTVA